MSAYLQKKKNWSVTLANPDYEPSEQEGNRLLWHLSGLCFLHFTSLVIYPRGRVEVLLGYKSKSGAAE